MGVRASCKTGTKKWQWDVWVLSLMRNSVVINDLEGRYDLLYSTHHEEVTQVSERIRTERSGAVLGTS